jgi:hypothetical protein
MQTKNIVKILLTAAAAYGVIYVYQRYKRKKANENVVPADTAINVINKL